MASVSTVHEWEEWVDMHLKDSLLRGIFALGWDKPSTIQRRAVVPFVQGSVVCLAQPSSGSKIDVCAIGTLECVDFDKCTCQALIVTPTKEMALQIHTVICSLGRYLSNGKYDFCCVLQSPHDAMTTNSQVLIAIGTLDRMTSLMKAVRFDELNRIVLVGADTMPQEGMHELFQQLPTVPPVAVLSNTCPLPLLEFTETWLHGTPQLLIKAEELTLAGIEQFYVAVEETHKVETLLDLYASVYVAQSVVFCNTKRKVKWLGDQMEAHGFAVSLMYTDMSDCDRATAIDQFRSGTTRVLVTTTLRTYFTVPSVNFVVNFDVSSYKIDYIDRIGRGELHGSVGIAISLVTSKDFPLFEEIEAWYQTNIVELPGFTGHIAGYPAWQKTGTAPNPPAIGPKGPRNPRSP
eukprot:TRINITY_DN53111_c0_g1_i1.p1 TRINITY_DN53111_c0_g1~~TRINITY_DN53111_c0_g1_i1.p1  ORF type:complete len:405 (+),score=34.85 TRINITY_DN53111_c0_g1_i1:35-1249(+)